MTIEEILYSIGTEILHFGPWGAEIIAFKEGRGLKSLSSPSGFLKVG